MTGARPTRAAPRATSRRTSANATTTRTWPPSIADHVTRVWRNGQRTSSRLLPQPHGFEGVDLGWIDRQVDCLPVAHPPKVHRRLHTFQAGVASTDVQTNRHHHAVPPVNELLRLHPKVVEDLHLALHQPFHPFAA